MEGLVKGDVVVLDYPYTDFSQFKRRPALVVSVLSDGQNIVLCQITSQFKADPDAVLITGGDFTDGGLTQPVSNVRPNHLLTVHQNRVLRRAGALTQERLDLVVAVAVAVLQRS